MNTSSLGPWADRQIDEALVAIATGAGVLYTRRAARRLAPKVAIGVAVVAGAGLAAAAVAGATGLLAAGGAAVWYRRSRGRARDSAPTPMPYPGVDGAAGNGAASTAAAEPAAAPSIT